MKLEICWLLLHLDSLVFAKLHTYKLLLLLRLFGAHSIIQIGLCLQENTLLVIYKSWYYSMFTTTRVNPLDTVGPNWICYASTLKILKSKFSGFNIIVLCLVLFKTTRILNLWNFFTELEWRTPASIETTSAFQEQCSSSCRNSSCSRNSLITLQQLL